MQSSIHILHLDDNPQDAELIRRKLGSEGLSCDVTGVTDKASFESALDGAITLCPATAGELR